MRTVSNNTGWFMFHKVETWNLQAIPASTPDMFKSSTQRCMLRCMILVMVASCRCFLQPHMIASNPFQGFYIIELPSFWRNDILFCTFLCVWYFLTVKKPSGQFSYRVSEMRWGTPWSQWNAFLPDISLCKVDELMSYLVTSAHKKGMPTLRSCQREANFPSIDELRSWRGRRRGSWGQTVQ